MASRKQIYRPGFSLLELIIVLALMIGLLAVAWPNLQRPLRRNSISEAAQVLRGAIDDCRYQAITTGSPVFMQLRQGDSFARSGSFDSFMNFDSELGGAALGGPTNSENSAAATQLGDLQSQSKLPALRTWNLPPTVIIRSVSWTLDSPSEEDDEEFESEGASQLNADPSSQSTLPLVAEIDSEASFAGLGQPQATWWLPLVATGQGRDAMIVLYDTSINEEMTVTFVSATGSLEISR